MRAAIVIGMLGVSSACYTYNPLTTPSPEPGSYVVVRLTDAASIDLAPYLGPTVFVVKGRYVGDSAGGIVVSVNSVELQRGDELSWAGERIRVANGQIASLGVRRLAKGRSLLLAGVSAGGLVATTLAFSLNGGGTPLPPGHGLPHPQ